ncbi:SIS domain-containing protein [Paenibacillus koleovorans]|uniref:SIS domain-containing protein n=1 Tax=Paenibacillus koleovorans TaxID=121608 RepID=UPI000FD8910F|nr:SIS domain-containing protein [Paenibacillus koleovorans]
MSITYSEMKNQYTALKKTFDYMNSKRSEIVSFIKSVDIQSITVIGCGSGYCLSQSAAFSAHLRAGLHSSFFAAGDIMLNFNRYSNMMRNTLILAPSRSGSTSEVIKAIQVTQLEQKVPVISII